MKTSRPIAAMATMLFAGSGGVFLATTGSTHEQAPGETVTIAADEPIPHLLSARLVAHVVDYEPGASSAAHHHPRSAFVYAYVVSGAIRSQVNDEPARVYRAGEAWFEKPNSYHRVSENASDSEPARLLAVLIVDGPDEQLVIPDSR